MQDFCDESESVLGRQMSPATMKIMLVEDDPILSALMTGLLKQWNHDVTVASNGLACIKLLKSEAFDLVLLDLQMPVMDGFDVLRWVRTHHDLKQCQFIVLSSSNEEQSIVRAFDLGADDYVSKPIEPKIFEVKLRNIVNRWRQSKINMMLLDSLAHKEAQLKAQADHERMLAEKIHNVMLRGEDRVCMPGFNLASYSRAANQVNGDFWDAYSLSSGTLDVIFGDVMGNGPLAAILAEQIKAKMLRSILEGAFPGSQDGSIPSPSDIVNRVHALITPKLIEIDAFITLIYIRLDSVQGHVATVSCGHAPPCRLRAGTIEGLGTSQLPLGVLHTEIYRQNVTDLRADDKIFMASDGISERRNQVGKFYQDDMNRILKSFSDSDYGVGALVGAIVADVERFSQDAGKGDDMTILLVKHSENHVPQSHFSLERDLSLSVILRERISDFLAAEGCAPQTTFLCMTACTEVFTNIVLHGCTEKPVDRIDWTFSHSDGLVTVIAEYSGPEFDPTVKLEPPVINLDTEGGLGLYMVQLSCSEMKYDHDFGFSRLILKFSDVQGVSCGS